MRSTRLCIILWALAGCASQTKVDCSHIDWYEIGRQQGIGGQTLSTQAPDLPTCKASQTNSMVMLKNGFETGLDTYCSDQNFFQMGYQQLSIPTTCPTREMTTLKTHFINGQKTLALEQMLKDLEAESNSIKSNKTREPASLKRSHQKLKSISLQMSELQQQILTLRKKSRAPQ